MEHGGYCRPMMDSVQGQLLIYRIKENTYIEKEMLFDWMRQLLSQILHYHQCHNHQNYRYVNPYSVLVTKENKILLLDLEAESNDFVLKNLQKRAMRAHFVKPVVHIKEGAGDALDLHGYGKTIQFMLANMKVEPILTRSQENRLEKIINKCLGENCRNQYKELKQIEKELPVMQDRKIWDENKHLVFKIAAVACAAVCVTTCYQMNRQQVKLRNSILELQRVQSENHPGLREEDVEVLIQRTEGELREELGLIKEEITGMSGMFQQHIEEESMEQNQQIEETESMNENIDADQVTAENGDLDYAEDITEGAETIVQE